MEKLFKSPKLVISIYVFIIILSLGFISHLITFVNYKYENLDKFQASNKIIPQVKASNEFNFKQSTLHNIDINLKKNEQFELIIPKIGLHHEIKLNVDPSQSKEYLKVLEKYIAHAKNTPTPQETDRFKSGNVYLFAHRTNFFKDLHKLEVDDIAYIKSDFKLYTYKLMSKQLVDKGQIDVLSGYSPTPILTLQTCTDKNEQRLILKFDLIFISSLGSNKPF